MALEATAGLAPLAHQPPATQAAVVEAVAMLVLSVAMAQRALSS
jgi:hypothetical protein